MGFGSPKLGKRGQKTDLLRRADLVISFYAQWKKTGIWPTSLSDAQQGVRGYPGGSDAVGYPNWPHLLVAPVPQLH